VGSAGNAGYREIAQWAVEDFLAEERERQRWQEAVSAWLDEVDLHNITLPTKYRGDFDSGIEDLAGVCLLYEKAATALGKKGIANEARAAAGALRYGVAPELVPLMALELPQLARARSRHLFERGVHNLTSLAAADAGKIADPQRAPDGLVRQWIRQASEIQEAKAVIPVASEEGAEELDEIVARFRIDPAALESAR
jgi:replicative superfamily II helicase